MVKQPRLMRTKKTLNDLNWDEIRAIADAGKAREYFQIGDKKAVHIQGTVGTQRVNATYYVYIIGFDHNVQNDPDARNTIDFWTFLLGENGVNICLIDSKYGSVSVDGTPFFNMNHYGIFNYGGWKGCDLRYDVLGSTDVPPSGYGSEPTVDRKGYDATPTAAIRPVKNNTLMSALPKDLRAVMKPMTVWTDNTGNSTGSSFQPEAVTPSVDFLPLPAVFEIFPKSNNVTLVNKEEKYTQSTYEYINTQFINQQIMKKQPLSPSLSAMYFLRSPAADRTSTGKIFTAVNGSGTLNAWPVEGSLGLAPIFRV